MKILRDRGPAFIFLLLVLSGGAEWDRWNDAPTESHVMPPMRGTDSQH